MKFKVGDKVRLTREAIALRLRCNMIIEEDIFNGVEIIKVDSEYLIYRNDEEQYGNIHKSEIELVPEEPEFEYGETVEVWDWYDEKWYKRIFISKIPGKVGCAYACVSKHKERDFKRGITFEVDLRAAARKPRPQLTRKEIAKKFGVSEDFTLVE